MTNRVIQNFKQHHEDFQGGSGVGGSALNYSQDQSGNTTKRGKITLNCQLMTS